MCRVYIALPSQQLTRDVVESVDNVLDQIEKKRMVCITGENGLKEYFSSRMIYTISPDAEPTPEELEVAKEPEEKPVKEPTK